MAEGLTFRFVFADESSGTPQEAPPEATPGAAQRTNPAQTPEAAPQPRPAPRQTAASPVAVSPAPRNEPPEGESQAAQRRPQAQRRLAHDRTPESGEAARLFHELLQHLSGLPTIGASISAIRHVLEPLLTARERIIALNERRQAAPREAERPSQQQESSQPRPRNAPPESTRTTTAPTTTSAAPPVNEQPQPAPSSSPLPTPRPPAQPPENAPPEPGEVRNPTPGAAERAMEQLVSALGPLPESQKELSEALKPLADTMGYSVKELVAAVERMRQNEAAPSSVASTVQTPKTPTALPTMQAGGHPQRPPRPGAATITSRDVRPSLGHATPASGAAASAATAGGAVEAAEATAGAGAAAAGVLGGPVGLIAGIAIVGAVGAAVRAFEGLVSAVHRVDRTFTDLSSRLAPFNGQLAFAEASVKMQQVLLDIERAGRLGGDLSRFTEERARLDREFQRIATEIEEAVLPAINRGLGAITDAVENVRTNMSAATDFLGNLLQGMSISEAATAAATNAIKKHADENSAKEKAKEAMDVAGIFFGNGDKKLSIQGIDYGDSHNWADFIPTQSPNRRRTERGFGGS